MMRSMFKLENEKENFGRDNQPGTWQRYNGN